MASAEMLQYDHPLPGAQQAFCSQNKDQRALRMLLLTVLAWGEPGLWSEVPSAALQVSCVIVTAGR